MIEKDCDDWKGLWWLERIVIIEKDCDDWKGLWWLKTIVIKEIYACNRMNFSGNVNEVITAVLKSLFIFTERFCTH